MVQRNRRNYYRVLHVQPDAPLAVIKSSYRALMLSLEMHPDFGGDHWNAAVINEAYEVLSDPRRRDRYDRDNAASSPSGRRGGPKAPRHRPGPIDAADGFRCVFCGARASALLGYVERCDRCHSPLTVPDKIETGGSGTRLTDRVPLRAQLAYFDAWPQHRPHVGLLADLSPNGIRFAGDHPVEEHRIIKIDSALISATARVIYCRSAPWWGEWPCNVGADFYTLEFRNPSGTFLSTQV